jgi:hypothetical protein
VANSGGYKKHNNWQSAVMPIIDFGQQRLNGAADWSDTKGGQVLPPFKHIVSVGQQRRCVCIKHTPKRFAFEVSHSQQLLLEVGVPAIYYAGVQPFEAVCIP